MKKIKQMSDLLKEGNGYIKTNDALNLNISAPYFYYFVEEESLVQVSRGLYKTRDSWDDELYEISALNKRICFSHETSLYLNNLMEREPYDITVTAPRGYNATHLRQRGIKVFQLEEKLFLLGQTELKTVYGNIVKSYNSERAMCDLMRIRDKTDIQIFSTAFKLYIERNDKNIPLLMKYAKEFNIEEDMRKYLEVLLWLGIPCS